MITLSLRTAGIAGEFFSPTHMLCLVDFFFADDRFLRISVLLNYVSEKKKTSGWSRPFSAASLTRALRLIV